MAADDGATSERARRLPPAERRQHLVEAALGVFAARGYAGTELGDIAAEAGVGRPLLYHYFKGGKEDLYVAVLEHAWSELIARLEVDPQRGRGMLPSNLAAYLDLVEAKDPVVMIIRGSRRLEGERIETATRNAGVLMARGMAMNQLGMKDPPADVLAALLGFLAYFDVLLLELAAGRIERDDVERLVAGTLPAIADAAAG
jgi:AcrR family transcriptional regulator